MKYKLVKKEYLGNIPLRTDEMIQPKSRYQKIKEELIYRYFQLTDNIPSIKEKRDIAEVLWHEELQNYKDEQLARKRSLNEGFMTLEDLGCGFNRGFMTLEDLGCGFNRPFPRPYKPGHEFDGWKITNINIVNLLGRESETNN